MQERARHTARQGGIASVEFRQDITVQRSPISENIAGVELYGPSSWLANQDSAGLFFLSLEER